MAVDVDKVTRVDGNVPRPVMQLRQRRGLPAAWLILSLLGGCTAGCSAATVFPGGDAYALSGGHLPKPAVPPRTLFGAYLAGNFAASHHDDSSALTYYNLILRHDPGNGIIAERGLSVAVDAGRFDLAVPLVRQILKRDDTLPLANLVEAAAELKARDADKAVAAAKRLPGQGIYALFGSLVTAWCLTAEGPDGMHDVPGALAPLRQDPQLSVLATLNAAMMEDLADQKDAADRDYRAALGSSSPPLRLAELAGNFWERNGKRPEADAIYKAFGRGAGSAIGIAPHLSAEAPARLIATPAQGLAEAMFEIAGLAAAAGAPDTSLVATRLALMLRPDFPQAQFTLADILAARGQLDDARAAYRAISPSSALGWEARLAEVELLLKLHHPDEAAGVLKALIAARPDQVEPVIMLGDLKRGSGDTAGAIAAYDKALRMVGPDAAPAQLGGLYFSRGAAREQSGQWPEGEADLRHALALVPGSPELLNYLGFAMVLRDENLPQARALIARAVEAQPNEGAYVDSLGWADFHLHQCRLAATELEHAIQLWPSNAEVNDHLGDAYWRCGRKSDAKLQWRRALSLGPDPALAKSIQTKLGSGTLP